MRGVFGIESSMVGSKLRPVKTKIVAKEYHTFLPVDLYVGIPELIKEQG